jgi:hypothetical protein
MGPVVTLAVLTIAAAVVGHLPWIDGGVHTPDAATHPGIVPGRDPRPHTLQRQPDLGTCHYSYTAAKQPLPDPVCTPGARNPNVTQANLASTICRNGYTASIRPPPAVTGPEKRANAKAYAYKGNPGDADYDHLISLDLGGDPTDPGNLWVEMPSPGHPPGGGVGNPKDAAENWLNKAVCNAVHLKARGQGNATSYLPLDDAQRLIATDWTSAVQRAAALMVKPVTDQGKRRRTNEPDV